MRLREEIINIWFDMWLGDDVTPMDAIFTENVSYSECWGLDYEGLEEIRRWFADWHRNNKMLVWEVKQFIHENDKTVAQWHMEAEDVNGTHRCLDGLYLIEWDESDRIQSLREYGAKCEKIRPYQA